MYKKEILQTLHNYLQTFDSNGLGWELNGIDEDDIEELAEEIVKKLIIADVVKSLPVDRETALKVREDIINEHYKDDPNKSTFGLAFITCYDWLEKLCTK